MGRNKLGKGIKALMGDDALVFTESAGTIAAGAVMDLNPAVLQPNPFQPRTVFNDETLQELADSIAEHGIIQPIIVEKKDGQYYIVAGERRTRAAIRAGLERVPVIIRNFDESVRLEIALIENIHRENLNPIEEAKAYQKLMNLSGINQEEAAKRVGKSRSAVANAIRLLQLPVEIQQAVEEKQISAGHARTILSLASPTEQMLLFTRIVENGLSVRDTELQASQLKSGICTTDHSNKQSTNSCALPDAVFALKDIEQQFIDALGTKVELKGGLEKGSVTISYFSRSDLDALYEKIIR